MGRKTPCLESVGLSRNQLGQKFGQQFIAVLVEAIEVAKQEAIELVTSRAAAGDLGNQNLQFDTLEHLILKKVDLSHNRISSNILNTIQALLKDLEEFKEQAKIHQNYIQMQV